ncbi:MAG: hypothetical protein B9S32_15575 [Verrucomicrobia bacterium Tous-C9LFEB]|nr:MAG: hypothetical protein B9S32_15575 [Verrucomicrobia bacterium Tous-C9LFEB]
MGCQGNVLAADGADSPKNEAMGVATHFARKERWMSPWNPSLLIPQIAELHVGWIRDEIMWSEVEPELGVYRLPEKTREWVDLANAHGLKIIACFSGQNPLYKDRFDPDAYARAAAWLARALDGKIHALEILNEPMSYYAAYYGEGGMKGGNWWGLDNAGEVYPWVRRYVTLLNKAADAIKAANPQMPVIGLGSLSPINFHQLKLGISPRVDGITDHPYSFRTAPEVINFPDIIEFQKLHGFAVADKEGSFVSLIERYREFSKQYNGPKQLWLTEWGHSTFREGAAGENYLYSAFSEEAQARYTLRRFVECLGMKIDVSILYAFMDDQREGGEFNCENGFGVIRKDHSRKPVFAAVQRVAKATIGFSRRDTLKVDIRPFSDRTEDRPPVWDGVSLPALRQIRQYQFVDSRKRSVLAIWSCERLSDLNDRTADLEISGVPEGVTLEILDLMTGSVSVPKISQKNGKILLSKLRIPPYPLLITVASPHPSTP